MSLFLTSPGTADGWRHTAPAPQDSAPQHPPRHLPSAPGCPQLKDHFPRRLQMRLNPQGAERVQGTVSEQRRIPTPRHEEGRWQTRLPCPRHPRGLGTPRMRRGIGSPVPGSAVTPQSPRPPRRAASRHASCSASSNHEFLRQRDSDRPGAVVNTD